MTLGQKARALREAQLRDGKPMTRRQLEDETGVAVRTIEYLEKDAKDPRRETLEALAQVLGAELLQAAFPGLIPIRSRKSAKARYLTSDVLGLANPANELALSASG